MSGGKEDQKLTLAVDNTTKGKKYDLSVPAERQEFLKVVDLNTEEGLKLVVENLNLRRQSGQVDLDEANGQVLLQLVTEARLRDLKINLSYETVKQDRSTLVQLQQLARGKAEEVLAEQERLHEEFIQEESLRTERGLDLLRRSLTQELSTDEPKRVRNKKNPLGSRPDGLRVSLGSLADFSAITAPTRKRSKKEYKPNSEALIGLQKRHPNIPEVVFKNVLAVGHLRGFLCMKASVFGKKAAQEKRPEKRKALKDLQNEVSAIIKVVNEIMCQGYGFSLDNNLEEIKNWGRQPQNQPTDSEKDKMRAICTAHEPFSFFCKFTPQTENPSFNTKEPESIPPLPENTDQPIPEQGKSEFELIKPTPSSSSSSNKNKCECGSRVERLYFWKVENTLVKKDGKIVMKDGKPVLDQKFITNAEVVFSTSGKKIQEMKDCGWEGSCGKCKKAAKNRVNLIRREQAKARRVAADAKKRLNSRGSGKGDGKKKAKDKTSGKKSRQ